MRHHYAMRIFMMIWLLGAVACAKQENPSHESGSPGNWATIQAGKPAPIRSITRRGDGLLLGPVSTGRRIEVWASRDGGVNWSPHGSIAESQTVEYGDPMMLSIPGTSTVFCAFREHANGKWQVTVSRSDNGGDSWVYDSTVVGPVEPFVGAPFLHLANNGDLQVYYDSELLASDRGFRGQQWIAMQGRHGTRGAWNAYGLVAAARMPEAGAMSREGMATVVALGGDRILLVTEGVEPFATGNAHANEVHAVESWDGGRNWDLSTRRTVYRARVDGASGRRYNAYVPYARRVGGGPVGVAFCTDEDFAGRPDAANASVTDRHCHVKYVQTTTNFESWSAPSPIWTNSDRNYTPGLFERAPNDLIVTVDQFGAGMRILHR